MDLTLYTGLSYHKNMRRVVVLATMTLVAFTYFNAGGPGVAAAADDTLLNDVAQEAKIAKIPLIYARGVDTWGNERNTTGFKERGIEWFNKGFTEDATFEVIWPDGSGTGLIYGAEGFYDFAMAIFEDGVRNTHHAMPNILVEEVNGNTAKIHTYGIVRHLKTDNSSDIAILFYTDKCIRKKGLWKSFERKIYVISFDNFVPLYSLP